MMNIHTLPQAQEYQDIVEIFALNHKDIARKDLLDHFSYIFTTSQIPTQFFKLLALAK